jgi:hypothetical protein
MYYIIPAIANYNISGGSVHQTNDEKNAQIDHSQVIIINALSMKWTPTNYNNKRCLKKIK